MQMVALAQEAVARFNPDLVILAFSNPGTPAFLWDAPVESYFERYPDYWRILFAPDLAADESWFEKVKFRLVRHVHIYRFLMLGLSAAAGDRYRWRSTAGNRAAEELNIRYTRSFLAGHLGRVPIAIFICPGVASDDEFIDYYANIDVPVFRLKADGLPAEYREIHPPAHVMTWYAEKLAAWLLHNDLIPK